MKNKEFKTVIKKTQAFKVERCGWLSSYLIISAPESGRKHRYHAFRMCDENPTCIARECTFAECKELCVMDAEHLSELDDKKENFSKDRRSFFSFL